MRLIAKGATSQTVYFSVNDSASTTGGKKTGIAFNAASLVASYTRNGAARTAITLATQTASGAWSSGGWVEVDATNEPGLYRFDVPDAAFASGVDSVVIQVRGASGMVDAVEEVQLTAVNLQDAVRAGLTALPNAAAEAAGGLYTRGAGAGQINQPANGRIDANVVAIGGTTQTARDLGASVLLSAGTGTGQLDFTSGVVKANLAQILGTALTETAGQIAAAFKQFFNIASPTSTMNLVTSVGSVTGAVGSVTGAVGSVTGAVGSVSGAVGSVTGNVGGNVTGSVGSVASGGITSGSFAAGAINAAAIATNAIDADALAADAVTEIAAGVSVGSAPTAAQNATAVRTELTTELARIDVAISTRAASSVGGTVGSGSRLITINVQKPGSTGPLEGVACWISTDQAGTNVIAGTLDTDTLGNVQFMLDNGTYWLWRQLSPYTFTPSPQDFTVS